MEGLARLARLEHARRKRIAAKFSKAHARMYSTDSKEYQSGMRHAATLLNQAERQEAVARYRTNDNPYDLSG
ncbi:hypothetical protein GF367_02540 [Candidatus Woesearchaeota archaeon]|nr:hypothetical protein [Candidatus Woesearchaeota archaeon]